MCFARSEHGCDMPWRAFQEQISETICEQIVDDQMVGQLVKLFNTETQDRMQQRTAEQIVDTSVAQIVEGLVEVTPEIQTVQEHSAVLVELVKRISGIMMKLGVAIGEDPFARVKGLIIKLISQLQKEVFEDDTAKFSSTLETAVSRFTLSLRTKVTLT